MQQTPDALGFFVGEWSMTAGFDPIAPVPAPIGRTIFSWLTGGRFLIQRWDIEPPDAPDGIAIIEFDPEQATYVQHYFDSRGVARVYEMTFAQQRLDAPEGRDRTGLIATLHRHIQRGRQHDRRSLGAVERRLELDARLRPHLHPSALVRLCRSRFRGIVC